MRTIKFRAWVIRSESTESINTMRYESNDVIFKWQHDGVTMYIMQFTGLTDKNGKEIYEGDLLRVPAKDHWEKENYTAYEVFWHDNDSAQCNVGWQLNRTHYHGSLCGTTTYHHMLPKFTKQMEIIGNIYQNPELTKNKY